MPYKIKYCPNCGSMPLNRNDEYADEYNCEHCQVSFEIMMINETGKEVIEKG